IFVMLTRSVIFNLDDDVQRLFSPSNLLINLPSDSASEIKRFRREDLIWQIGNFVSGAEFLAVQSWFPVNLGVSSRNWPEVSYNKLLAAIGALLSLAGVIFIYKVLFKIYYDPPPINMHALPIIMLFILAFAIFCAGGVLLLLAFGFM